MAAAGAALEGGARGIETRGSEAVSLLTPCVTLWIGPSLGTVERACLKSVLRQGHKLALYCYSPPEGVPAGVELRNAADILPQNRIIRHRTGSVALFANWFRYELQRRGLGTWVDTDAYLLKPLESEKPYLMGEEGPGRINNGLLRIPQDSPLLPPLLAVFEERSVPNWLPLRAKAAAWWRLKMRGRSGLAQMPWGSAGPVALTALAKQHNVAHLAEPPEVLYPMRWQDADWIRDPAVPVESVITEHTVSIHLWNERIKGFKNAPAPAGSFLAQLQVEGAPDADEAPFPKAATA